MLLRRPHDLTQRDVLRSRNAEIATANRWASRQQRACRGETERTLDEWAARLNERYGVGVPVVRIGLRLHAPRGLRVR